jgi:hypothetical protein
MHCSSASEAQRTFVGFHQLLPTLQKLLNSAKEWGEDRVFGVE